MLIVISILMILAVAAANVMRPSLDGRRIREAARAVNVYVSSARNRAMETGRPCGVVLCRFNNTPAVMNLAQCEVPASYSGDSETSTAQVTGNGATVTANMGTGYNPQAGVVNPGDLIQFNYQGPLYKITAVGPPITASLYTSQDQAIPWAGQSVPYRIFRSPVKVSAVTSPQAQPLQLPAGAVVDLGASGLGDGTTFGNSADVYIVFSPSGAVDQVSSGNSTGLVTQPIFLLIGKNEKLGSNDQDTTNFWVAINPQTGLVTTDMVAAGDSRQYVRDAQGMGGK